MGVLLQHKTRVIFVTASLMKENGKAREFIVESRPQYAVVRLSGSKQKCSVAWETIYMLAKEQHAESLRLEARSTGQLKRPRRKMTA
jgi:hypothetical protein